MQILAYESRKNIHSFCKEFDSNNNYLYVKVDKIRRFEFHLKMGQNAFKKIEPLDMYNRYKELQHIQIWIKISIFPILKLKICIKL